MQTTTFDNSISLSEQHLKKFKEGIAEIVGQKRVDEVIKTWTYAGGTAGEISELPGALYHQKYYDQIKHTLHVFPPFPKLDYCVCKHWIVVNCYIVNPAKTELIVCGSCCIKKFMDKSGKTCETCSEPHQSRKDNFCKKCRKNNVEIAKQNQQELDDLKEQEEHEQYEKQCQENAQKRLEWQKQNFYDSSILLTISYDDKEDAKDLGAKWSTEYKTWYVPIGHPNINELQKFGKIIALNVPFSEKNDAKELGVRWNNELRCWTTNEANPNLEDILEKWSRK